MGFRQKKELPQENGDKVIEINAQMQGSLVFKDPVNLKINGHFQGSLDVCGSLTIGNTAQVEANITADSVVIAGRVKGDITTNKMLVLMPSAVLRGNIRTVKLNIVEGAVFQGNCKMVEDVQDLLSMDEVSKYLEIDADEINRLANAGKIPAVKIGDSWKFEKIQIDNWAASAKVK